ncbi:hypothetical protein GGD62_007657 [Bradyrhizobium sp. ERR14]|nr:hypothetical protein [Bradyrhizobium sp. ERR14]
MRLLRRDPGGQTAVRRNRARIYQESERIVLVLFCEAADRVCGKRLKAQLPILIESMERHGRIDLTPEVRAKLLSMSAGTIDRALRSVPEQSGRQRRRSVASALRRTKRTAPPATPHQRLVAEARTPDAVRASVHEISAGLDPIALLHDIRAV